MKKKKLLTAILTLAIGVSTAIGLVSCQKHIHTFGEWVAYTTNEISCENRLFFRTCTECNTIEWKQGVYDDHNWSKVCSFDNSFHWYKCETCREIKEKAEHIPDDTGYCTVCDAPIGATVGLIYDISTDGTYAEVIGYEGVAKRIIIAKEYNGLPVKAVSKKAFYKNDNITVVVIPDSVIEIGEEAFQYCFGLTSIVIPESVTVIDNYAFFNCYKLTSIVIPDSVTSIGNCAFAACQYLTSIEIGDNVKIIGERAFDGSGLMSIMIPDNVTSIGDYAFYECKSLTNIEIGDNVTTIGLSAFRYCKSLSNIYVSENNQMYQSIGGNLYSKDGRTLIQYAVGKAASSFTIPASVTKIGLLAFECCNNLTDIQVSKNNQTYQSIDGNLYSKDGKILIQYAVGKMGTSFTIPNGVTKIGREAFYGCKNLVSISIPGTVTTIGYQAFSDCSSLTSVVIPDSVTTIGEWTFKGCRSLTSVAIGDGVTTIGYATFYGCSSLTSVVIPDSVTSVGGYAFYNCGSVLYVYYKGTANEWDSISIENRNPALTDAIRYYYVANQSDVPNDNGKYWHYDENGEIAVW